MIGAQTRKWICLPVVRNADVPHLRVQEAVEQAPMDYSPTPDTSAGGDVQQGIKALGGSPALLSKRRGVHISIESDWETQSTAERPGQVSASPAWLRR